MTIRYALVGFVFTAMAGLTAEAAEPITVAPFTLSDKQLTCPSCLPDWRAILRNALKPMRPEGMKVMGTIALVDVSDPRVTVMTSKQGGTKECQNNEDIASNYEALGKIPLPIRLRTAEEWAKKVKLTLALNANPFKTEQTAKDAAFTCGGITGPYVTSGVIEWPPIERKDMLSETIDSDPNRPTWAFTVSKEKNVFIRQVKSYSQLQEYAHVIAGEPLFIGYGNFMSDTKAAKARQARLGIGFLPGRKQILIIRLEGRVKDDSAAVTGFPRQALTNLFRAFGALAALELPGGDYAQLASKDGQITALKNPPAVKPVAVHLGFRLAPSKP